VFDALRAAGKRIPPWLITEGGLDIAGDKQTSGWRGPDGPGEAQYADQCVFAAQQVARFPEVQCYALFTALPTDWASFDVTESLWRRLEAIIMAENVQPTPLSPEWIAAARQYKIDFNPDAALCTSIAAAGQYPLAEEWVDGGVTYQWGLDVLRLTWHLWSWTATAGVKRVYSEPVTR